MDVIIELDTEPRTVTVLADLAAALANEPEARRDGWIAAVERLA